MKKKQLNKLFKGCTKYICFGRNNLVNNLNETTIKNIPLYNRTTYTIIHIKIVSGAIVKQGSL